MSEFDFVDEEDGTLTREEVHAFRNSTGWKARPAGSTHLAVPLVVCESCEKPYRPRQGQKYRLCRDCSAWVPPPMPALEADVETCLAFLKLHVDDWLWSQ